MSNISVNFTQEIRIMVIYTCNKQVSLKLSDRSLLFKKPQHTYQKTLLRILKKHHIRGQRFCFGSWMKPLRWRQIYHWQIETF